MEPLRLIGYWIRSLDDDELPPPQELVVQRDTYQQRKVASYLESGTTLNHYRGMTWCRCFCDRPMGSRELTDGKWAWPEDLSHYVRDHNVQLPWEFVQTACCADVDGFSVKEDLFRRGTDLSYWVSWCDAHRSNALRLKIQAARDRALQRSERLKERVIARIQRDAILSGKPCKKTGCTGSALTGCGRCLDCYVETQYSWRLRRPFGKLKPVLNEP